MRGREKEEREKGKSWPGGGGVDGSRGGEKRRWC